MSRIRKIGSGVGKSNINFSPQQQQEFYEQQISRPSTARESVRSFKEDGEIIGFDGNRQRRVVIKSVASTITSSSSSLSTPTSSLTASPVPLIPRPPPAHSYHQPPNDVLNGAIARRVRPASAPSSMTSSSSSPKSISKQERLAVPAPRYNTMMNLGKQGNEAATAVEEGEEEKDEKDKPETTKKPPVVPPLPIHKAVHERNKYLLNLFKEKGPQKFSTARKAFISSAIGTSTVTREEFKEFAKLLGIHVNPQHLEELFSKVSEHSEGITYRNFLKQLWPDDSIRTTNEPALPQRPIKYLLLQERGYIGDPHHSHHHGHHEQDASSPSSRIRYVLNENVPLQHLNDGNFSSVTYNIIRFNEEYRPSRPLGQKPPLPQPAGDKQQHSSRNYPGMKDPFGSDTMRRLLMDKSAIKSEQLPLRVASFATWQMGQNRFRDIMQVQC